MSEGAGRPIIEGTTIRLEPLGADHARDLEDLDWSRSLHPAMAGPLTGDRGPDQVTYLVRSKKTGLAVGVLDSVELAGYPGVANVSLYTDAAQARAGLALEAYGRFVLMLFDGGARLIHHEVLALNRPIQRIFAGMGLEPSADLRSHAYVAGRFWDVLVYSYDRATLDQILQVTFPRADAHLREVPASSAEEVPPRAT